MPSAMSGKNIKLTHPLCHELWKMVLSVLFSFTISHTWKKHKAPPNVAKARGHIQRWDYFSIWFMPLAMSGENIKLTCPLCHELWKMVLSILFSYTIPYMEKNIKHH